MAAGIPLLLALTAVFATFGLIALPSAIFPVAMQAPALVLLIGLAVGVDYSMFYLKREREERAAGRSEQAALEAAAATSGRSVLISGLTVIVAMAGMFLTGDKIFASLGVAAITVVAIAMLGSLTVLPALLSKLGDRVDGRASPRRPASETNGEGRVWGAIVDRVLRRPLVSAVVAGGLLLALAAPALQLRMATPGPDTFPQSLPVIQAYTKMQQAFPGKALPANVVVQAPNVNAPVVQEAIRRLEQRALASGRMHEPITVDVNADGTVANISIPIDGKTTDREAVAALGVLRDEIVPNTVGGLPDVEAGVTGLAAQWQDGSDELKSNLPPVVVFVLLFAFALMLVAFRSIVVAAKAIVLNLLSVGAAYGVLVLVFQHGLGKGLLGFTSTAGIEPVVPLLLFVILFGLSMDYHVLVLGRIRELYDRGESMDDAISHGIKRTAGVVTSAAVVMVFVFSIFATLSMLFFKQFGVGLAVAILIDATIVRAVLLPASMKLLGEWNWYLPGGSGGCRGSRPASRRPARTRPPPSPRRSDWNGRSRPERSEPGPPSRPVPPRSVRVLRPVGVVAGDVDVAGAERPRLPRFCVVRVSPDAARVVRQQVDGDGRLGGRRPHPVDVVVRRDQRVEVARTERPALDELERAASLRVDLLVLHAAIEADEPPGEVVVDRRLRAGRHDEREEGQRAVARAVEEPLADAPAHPALRRIGPIGRRQPVRVCEQRREPWPYRLARRLG